MVRTPCCKGQGLKKGAWTEEEDQKLIVYVQLHGEGGWRTLPDKAGLKRCGKSCRLRWANYLRPDIKRGEFSREEEDSIIELHAIHGNKWSAIARKLQGRTDNEIKNHYNTHIKKHLFKKGIDPFTHKSLLTSGDNKSPNHSPNHPKSLGDDHDHHQKSSNDKSQVSSSSSARFLNIVANTFGKRLSNHCVLSDIIISGGPLSSQTTITTSVSKCGKSTCSPSNLLINQNMMNLDATSLSSSTFSNDTSEPSMYDNIFDDIDDIKGFSSRFLSDVVSHDHESCLENTLFMRELPMIIQEETASFLNLSHLSHVTPIDKLVDDSIEEIENYFG